MYIYHKLEQNNNFQKTQCRSYVQHILPANTVIFFLSCWSFIFSTILSIFNGFFNLISCVSLIIATFSLLSLAFDNKKSKPHKNNILYLTPKQKKQNIIYTRQAPLLKVIKNQNQNLHKTSAFVKNSEMTITKSMYNEDNRAS